MSQSLRCVNHPNAETVLRCNRCGKPICMKCAVRTPVGYRCRDCVRQQQRVFFDEFRPQDYLLVVLIALPPALIAGWLVPRLGWYAIILGPIAGSVIARLVRWALRRRHGEHTGLVVCGCILAGGLLNLALTFLGPLLSGATAMAAGSAGSSLIGAGLAGLLWTAVYLATAVGAAYAWFRPGRTV